MRLFIKNMVCPRCIMAVRTILVAAGVTPREILLGEVEIGEIAYKLDYSSPAHFSAQFKQITGMTPRMMRSQRPDSRIPLTEI